LAGEITLMRLITYSFIDKFTELNSHCQEKLWDVLEFSPFFLHLPNDSGTPSCQRAVAKIALFYRILGIFEEF
jgi:hypothetical protein